MAVYYKSERYSKPSDIYIKIESTPEPTPTEATPLLYSAIRSSKPIFYDSGCSCNTNSTNNNYFNNHVKPSFKINHKKKCCCDLPLLGIGILLIGGCIIATYLLILETRFIGRFGYTLDYVNHNVWSKVPLEINNVLNNSNILHVLILQTGGDECDEMENCVNLLRKMQQIEKLQKKSEIPYNFLISPNGQTYEIRGWHYKSGFNFIPAESSLVIGLIGNFTYKSPSEQQILAIKSLIHESERINKLHKTFQIYGVQNLTISYNDGEQLYNHVSKLHKFDTLLKIL